nr:FAD-linked oxidase C-terminal domain-containing protein [Candidatus Sigynarchaeota archaeon]
GTLGIVTWASIKCEIMPTVQHLHHVSSTNLRDLLAIQHLLIKFRLCDETFIMNQLGLAALLEKNKAKIDPFAHALDPWNLIFVTAGHGVLAAEKVAYLDEDAGEILAQHKGTVTVDEGKFDHQAAIAVFSNPADQWRSRPSGAHEPLFFTTGADKIPGFVNLSEQLFTGRGVIAYIQPGNLGTSCHCEFDVAYEPGSSQDVDMVKSRVSGWQEAFIQHGAFFSRPYGNVAKLAFQHYNQANIAALKKVKAIFDPKNILNPGALCFGDTT